MLLDAPAPAAPAPLGAPSNATGIEWIPAIGVDGAAFPIEKMAAHRSGQLHQAVSVFVFDGANLLLQRRAAGKYHCGGLWANTCCSHPHWGEAPAAAAHRRLREELGVSLAVRPTGVLEYRAAVTAGLIEHERVHIFRADGAPALALNPIEVDAVAWAPVAQIMADAHARPHAYTPWFRIYLARWDELGL
jgi:isopentenyl-diphosphate Delta-isomerase